MYIKILFRLRLKDKENKNFHMYEYLFHLTVYMICGPILPITFLNKPELFFAPNYMV